MQGEDALDEGGDPGGDAPDLAQESPVLEGGHGLFNECADLGVGPIHGLLTGKKSPIAPNTGCRPCRRPRGIPCRPQQGVSACATASAMPCSRAARMSWTAPSSADEAHSSRQKGSVRTCTFMPCFLCLPEWNGRSAAIPSMGRTVPASEQDERPRCFADGVFERGCRGGQEVDGFGDVPASGRRPDAERGCELGVGRPVAEVVRVSSACWSALSRSHRLPTTR